MTPKQSKADHRITRKTARQRERRVRKQADHARLAAVVRAGGAEGDFWDQDSRHDGKGRQRAENEGQQ